MCHGAMLEHRLNDVITAMCSLDVGPSACRF